MNSVEKPRVIVYMEKIFNENDKIVKSQKPTNKNKTTNRKVCEFSKINQSNLLWKWTESIHFVAFNTPSMTHFSSELLLPKTFFGHH